MRSKKGVNWRIGFAVCSLFYVGWVIYLSLNNFDMVNSRYRKVGEQLQPTRIREIALQELVDQCRKETKSAEHPQPAVAPSSASAEDPCLSPSAADLETRQKTLQERLVHDKNMATWKLIIFYVFYGLIFIVLPLVLLYLWFLFCLWLYRTLRPVRDS